jgi:GTP pyrophosphokinase
METTRLRPEDRSPEVAGIRQQVLALVDTLEPATAAAIAAGDAVLELVASLEPDATVAGAALLAPLLAGGHLTLERAQTHLPRDIVRLAQALPKLASLDALPTTSSLSRGPGLSGAQAESLRRMMLSVVDDPRLVVLRLAVQLHRLRTAKHAPEDEQRQLALQTREVYAPLANRLGLGLLKWELEDLSFRYLEPDAYRRIAAVLSERRADREQWIADVRQQLTEELADAGISGHVEGRAKHLYSIWRKMQKKGLAFEQLFDVRAVRILVDDVPACYGALGVVHSLFAYLQGEFDDYIATPKPNGYRSIHTAVLGPGDKTLEVQIRTHEMHQTSEHGVASHWRYKEGSVREAGYDAKLNALRDLLAPRSPGEGDFLDQLGSQLFAERVYVLSPRGDVVELPAGATPLDFAYQLHTDLGHRCRGAKVNGRMVPLTTQLKNGEQVEIVTAKQSLPSRDWLVEANGFLVTRSARSKVRAFFRREDEGTHRQDGKEVLAREMAKAGDGAGITLPVLLHELGFDNAEELYLAIGEGETTAAAVSGAIGRLVTRLRAAQATEALASGQPAQGPHSRQSDKNAPRNTPSGVQVMGVGDLLSSFARCCRPVPPEPIAGFITVGRGLTLHRTDCVNLKRLRAKDPERVMEVSWGSAEVQEYSAVISLQALDRRGLLRDISGLMTDEKISIDRMSTASDHARGTADMDITVRVPHLEALRKVMDRLGALPDVLSVRRRG